MPSTEEMQSHLAAIPNLTVLPGAPLSRYTRFGIGGPADIYVETEDAATFTVALKCAKSSGLPVMVIGGGTNLIVSDAGYRGIVLRYRGANISVQDNRIAVDAGVDLQTLVDFSIVHGLKGLETLAGIPGWVGAAVYGNAGAYGHSISERVESVTFFDGDTVRRFQNAECEFRYRESIFKRRKEWIIFSTLLTLEPADGPTLREIAEGILKVRNEKFPVTMKCAGSIFKNLLLNELPRQTAAEVPPIAVREGKIPAGWFLEQVGAKGMQRGDIHVATYHANLLYNAGAGTAADLRALINELKRRVRERFGIEIEEEVQYVGWPTCDTA
ncbi:MAG TPA: UDP-N-acetylmuramate dehydrogenase [Bryobacteraceae bacterium]|nr:UDP-N-acetylmuramate dehydrogenase [Bryobacteraceae bacterium]